MITAEKALAALEEKIKQLISVHNQLKEELLAALNENQKLLELLQNPPQNPSGSDEAEAETKKMANEIYKLKSDNLELSEEIERLQKQLYVLSSQYEARENLELKLEEIEILKEEKLQLKKIVDEQRYIISELSKQTEETNPEGIHETNDMIKSIDDNFANEIQTTYEKEIENLRVIIQEQMQEIERLKNNLKEYESAGDGFSGDFHNKEILTKIAISNSDKVTDISELKLRINEYIREIDKCITQLSE
ncbi:MAG: hypothetical protein NZ529_06360 [Cytophagaceae bacterium]|nr:hypothetical protein [Cytophagaceae bacterium]MDW8456401.1 hypothetical protein [Cytophagaceae bacterium]